MHNIKGLVVKIKIHLWKFIGCLFIFFSTTTLAISGYFSVYQEMLAAQSNHTVQLQFPYNLNTDYVVTASTGSGSVTQVSNLAVIQTGAATSSAASMKSRGVLHYHSGQGCSCLFSALFSLGVTGNVQMIGVAGFDTTGIINDGFLFGYNDAAFGIFWYNNSTTPTFISQGTWNQDKLDGTGASGVTLDPTKGNMYKIQYQWLGFGVVKYMVGNPTDGSWILVHVITYPNSSSATTPTLGNASLQLYAVTTNTTNSSIVSISTSAMAGCIEGLINRYNDSRFAVWVSSTLNGAGDKSLLTIQNNSTFPTAGVVNRVVVYPDLLCLYNRGNNGVLCRVILNPSSISAFTFGPVLANRSVVSYDTQKNGIVSGGNIILTVFLPPLADAITISLADYGIALMPGEILTISSTRLTTNTTVLASLSWLERF